jgi:hypothetical protein
MSFREPNGVVMTVNMKLLGWKRRIAALSLRGRFATNQNGQAAKEKKQNVVAGAGCSENSSGFRLREKCFSLDIPFYRTSEIARHSCRNGWRTVAPSGLGADAPIFSLTSPT